MESKPWYYSKTIWTSLAALISAVAVATGLELSPEHVEALLFALLGLIGINLRLAVD